MLAYSVALFLIGSLFGSVIGGAYVLAEHRRRHHVTPNTLRRLRERA